MILGGYIPHFSLSFLLSYSDVKESKTSQCKGYGTVQFPMLFLQLQYRHNIFLSGYHLHDY